jgi:hypothetical protein
MDSTISESDAAQANDDNVIGWRREFTIVAETLLQSP